jgi:hypothetical protein
MARPIDFDDEAALEADEINKEVSQRDLSLKFSPSQRRLRTAP